MESVTSTSLAVGAFAIRVTDIRSVDLSQLHALSMFVGWPHRAEDWAFLRETGQGVAACDEIGRVLGSAMWFPHGDRFATVGMVITSPRLQTLGTGQWLMQHVLHECRNRRLRLHATRAARRLYLALDFIAGPTVFQCQGEAMALPSSPGAASPRRLDDADLVQMIELDGLAFGARRTALLPALFKHSTGYGIVRGQRLEAFALCRRFGRGHVVGPVVAAKDADAIAVVAPHVADHAGHFLRLDTPIESGEFRAFVAKAGLPVFDTVTTMSWDRAGPGLDPAETVSAPPCRTYTLASQALG